MAIIKMLNDVDTEDQSMNMSELGRRLVKRYPDFDVRNYGDTKLSKFLKKFDFLDISARGKDGTVLWVTLKDIKSKQTVPKSSNQQKRRKRIIKKK
jgi:hypothetical protein